jgi:hypothetical protein
MTKRKNLIEKNLFIIKWVDSSYPSNSQWEPISEIKEPEQMICISVGFILKETKSDVIMMPHITSVNKEKDEMCVCGLMTIPKVAILKRTKLKFKL